MSKGRTKVLLLAIEGDQLLVQMISRESRKTAEIVASDIKRRLRPEHASDVVLAGTDNAPFWFDSKLYPVLKPLSVMARQAGLLDIASLVEPGHLQRVPRLLPIKGAGRAVELDIPPAPDVARLHDLPSLPYGLIRGVEGMDAAAVASIVQSAKTEDDGFRSPVSRTVARTLLKQLTQPLPQRLPTALLEGSPFRHAWLMPDYDYGELTARRDDLFTMKLVGIRADGRLEVRELVTSYALHGLKETINADKTWLPSDNYFVTSEVLSSSVPHHWNKFVMVSALTLDVVASHLNHQSQKVGSEIYAALEADLRDSFTSIDSYNLLQSGQDPELARKRRQMTESVWGGLDLLLSTSKAGEALLAAVDSEEKLHAKAAKVACVEPWVIRRMTRMPHDALHELSFHGDFIAVARKLQHLGQHAQIKTRQEAELLGRLEAATIGLWSYGANDPQRLAIIGRTIARHGLAGSMRVAPRAIGRQGWEFRDWTQFVDDCIDIAGLAAVDFNIQGQPAMRRKARAELLADVSLDDVVRWSEKYHRFVANVALGASGKEVVPPPLFDVLDLQGTGWVARQLRTNEELAREGREMDHCVQSYGDQVQARRSVIFSLASPSGTDRITVELCAGQLRGWSLVQARRAHNDPVLAGSQARAALDEFLDRLEAQTPEIDPETLKKYRNPEPRRMYGESFMVRLIDTYGSQAWSMVRGMLPASAHGRIETKYEEIFWRVNARALAKCREKDLRHRAAGRAFDAMFFGGDLP